MILWKSANAACGQVSSPRPRAAISPRRHRRFRLKLVAAVRAPVTTIGTFNIGTGVQTTVTELHQLIAATVGVSRPPDHAEARTGEVHASALDPTRAGRVLGWRPDTDLTEGIKHTVDWLRALLDPHPAALAQV